MISLPALRSELLDVVYRFYPRGVLPYARIHVPPNEPSYDDTEEHLSTSAWWKPPTAGERSTRRGRR